GGSTEICSDGIDNNCDGQVDEGCGTGTTCTNPLSPSTECGAGARCTPTTTYGSPGQCTSPTGAGTQYSICSTHDDCAPTYLCVNVGGSYPYCLQFCTSYSQCPYPSYEDCYFFDPSIYISTQEWGACWDGLP
ncbi:MAG: MopE-related protein, partial [Polyangia bacterium]|nr:MopE-related protein [Polyangia bacterium]